MYSSEQKMKIKKKTNITENSVTFDSKNKKYTQKRARNSFGRDKNDDLDISFTFCFLHVLSVLISVFYVYVEYDLSFLIRESWAGAEKKKN